MKKISIFQSVVITAVMLIGSLVISSAAQAKTFLEGENAHAALGEYFKKYNAKGTIVVLDKRSKENKSYVFNQKRAKQRYSPASTYKIPHSLFALDAGLVKDEFQVFPWDGIKRGYSPHNQDQNLRSAMRNSAVWVYDIFAEQLGEKKAGNYLKKVSYGNADPTTAQGSYWIDGKLAISAHEQIEFLERLYKNELPFKVEHQLLVKDIMVVEAQKKWILRAKTGWQGKHGWWVGWVEWPTGPVFFALNIDTPERMKDVYKRQAIVRDILRSIGALPTNN
ncbi:Beta-lactamase [Colwellia psychrerythraea]|uniref:Beta-lactamase n=1 Tax=Colwellia psychrerythraea TaxID=28229 RepID=A0A099KMQ6_COLPS|nr:class D beta-lactamase [Colwellia psychrerythraea]KGJ90943.1 Beta-lactamase [Colwellia psychrerythraea]